MKPLRYLMPCLLLALAIACGSGDESATDVAEVVDSEGDTGSFEDRVIVNSDATYTVDDLVSAGYKKSRQIDTESLPSATDAVFGFFNQKDIEVWIYESHQAALDFGVDPADAIFGVKRAPTVGISVLPTERFVNKYGAYAVVGNLIMLCETELAICEALIAELD